MARNQDLNQKMREHRRENILNQALGLFAARGLAGTKIADIAAASGMSQGLIYHYFRSKDEVFVELIRTAFEKMNDACRYLEGLADPPRAKIRLALEGLLEIIDKDRNAARYFLLIAQATVSEDIPSRARRIIDRENSFPYEVMTRIIRAGQEDGSIKNHDPEDLALLLWTSINGLAINKAVHGRRFKTPDPDIIMGLFC